MDEENLDEKSTEGELTYHTFSQFLETALINSKWKVQPLTQDKERRGVHAADGWMWRLAAPITRLYCDECRGTRNFSGKWNYPETIDNSNFFTNFLQYTCKDCESGFQLFCLAIWPDVNNLAGEVIKVGQLPEIYPEFPRSLEKMLGDDAELFKKGLKCERFGLGIAAHAYYRRIIENHFANLIQLILDVEKSTNPDSEHINALESALHEQSFSGAFDSIKEHIPASLKIGGHNPITALHRAFSIGIHELTDEDALASAHNARQILGALTERIREINKEDLETKKAMGALLRENNSPPS